ncbi:MAG TPA: penicillin acylase family protein, partial [Trebonia sp.]
MRSRRISGRLCVGAAILALTGLAVAPGAGAAARTAGAGSAKAAGPVTVVGHGAGSAAISRDSYGVPTITASTTAGMWFGAGWAQAQDRLVQLELTRRAVEGNLSQIFGPSELSQDETVRTLFYTPAELKKQYASLPAEVQSALTAFSDGINAYERQAYASAASEQAQVPYEFFVLGSLLGESGPYRPTPWRPADSVAVGNFLARQFGGGGGNELQNLQFLQYLANELRTQGVRHSGAAAVQVFNDARWINDPTAPTTVPSDTAKPVTVPRGPAAATDRSVARTLASLSMVTPGALKQAETALARDKSNILQTGISLRVLSHGGSNAIAIAPSRSADGHALLWGAPQEGFGTPSVDGEEYLHGPD